MTGVNMFCKTIIFLFLMFECSSCNDDEIKVTQWTLPLLNAGESRYYFGIFFKANWFKAQQYCLFHGMHLASISSQDENDVLERAITGLGYGSDPFWTSGTDLGQENKFFWMANGRPFTYVNWNSGEPNNSNNKENCVILMNKDNKGLKWNDIPCFDQYYFICEIRTET